MPDFQQAVDGSQNLAAFGLKKDVEAHEKRIALLEMLITGNGTPSSGMLNQLSTLTMTMTFIRNDVADLRKLLEDEKKQRGSDLRQFAFPLLQWGLVSLVSVILTLLLTGKVHVP